MLKKSDYVCRGLFLAGLIAVWTGCGTTGTKSPADATPPGTAQSVTAFITDVPSDSVVALHVDITGIALTDSGSHTATLTGGQQNVEFRHLELAPTLFGQTANVNPQNYASLSCTFANPTLQITDGQGNITTLNGGTAPSVRFGSTTATIPLGFAFPAAGGLGIMLDFDIQKSVSTDSGGNYVISPVISTSLVSDSDAAPQLTEELGKVVSLSSSGMGVLLSDSGETIHATTDANTLFDSTVGGFSSMSVGEMIEITARFRSNENYLATFISAGTADPSLRYIGLVTSAGQDSLGNFSLSLLPQN